jgi:hypothetical protein
VRAHPRGCMPAACVTARRQVSSHSLAARCRASTVRTWWRISPILSSSSPCHAALSPVEHERKRKCAARAPAIPGWPTRWPAPGGGKRGQDLPPCTGETPAHGPNWLPPYEHTAQHVVPRRSDAGPTPVHQAQRRSDSEERNPGRARTYAVDLLPSRRLHIPVAPLRGGDAAL